MQSKRFHIGLWNNNQERTSLPANFDYRSLGRSQRARLRTTVSAQQIMHFDKDVVGWFRRLNFRLQMGLHVPFVANANAFEIRNMFNIEPDKSIALILGVYEENSDEVLVWGLLQADAADARTYAIMGEHPLVVLC